MATTFIRAAASKGEYRKGTVPVGSFAANHWGLYNVHGNVLEWCEDV
jgi:formylglycine-generating enzyme required for sulfatase activity